MAANGTCPQDDDLINLPLVTHSVIPEKTEKTTYSVNPISVPDIREPMKETNLDSGRGSSLSKNQKLAKQVAAVQNRLKAIQANPALRKDYRQAIQELIKLRRQQIRTGKNHEGG